MHVEHSRYHRCVGSTDMRKIILQPFRPIKIDVFSYSCHQNPIRTHWDRVSEKNVYNFFSGGHIPY